MMTLSMLYDENYGLSYFFFIIMSVCYFSLYIYNIIFNLAEIVTFTVLCYFYLINMRQIK